MALEEVKPHTTETDMIQIDKAEDREEMLEALRQRLASREAQSREAKALLDFIKQNHGTAVEMSLKRAEITSIAQSIQRIKTLIAEIE